MRRKPDPSYVERVLTATKAAGHNVTRYSIAPDGTLTVQIGQQQVPANDLDKWIATHADQT
jgi:hypothetical protein